MAIGGAIIWGRGGFGIKLDDEKLARLDSIAKALNRSRASVINEAVERYLDYEEWFIQQVQERLTAAEAGNLCDHEQIVKQWEARLEAQMNANRKP